MVVSACVLIKSRIQMPFQERRKFWIDELVQIYSLFLIKRLHLGGDTRRTQVMYSFHWWNFGVLSISPDEIWFEKPPATYQRRTQDCLGDLNFNICMIFTDDLCLKLFPKKCKLFRCDVTVISESKNTPWFTDGKRSPTDCILVGHRNSGLWTHYL